MLSATSTCKASAQTTAGLCLQAVDLGFRVQQANFQKCLAHVLHVLC
jgi:hypothetical protein